ncbi:hypothetical protein AVCANL279_07405 [Campylobacter canadensis]|uniref:hypothetical protein n=1 Tax=Campylobacter canadensis TaxID=449520 RepID=UPI0015558BCE|nr:hypothetical protein [Campylobacter canadensis]MBZ7995157.1 hypothetical protein [Campylobacter canadensis]MBZ7997145.1 hypothetical protein [Campylobacter canadensis]MBZ8000522.1 hypothetical protein [Campylobacter canadensis]MBZ8003833.1 hypothetical protein [Campylobacter canadensis]
MWILLLLILFIPGFFEIIIGAFFYLFIFIIGVPVFYFNELTNPSYKLFPSIFVGFINASLCFAMYAFFYNSGVKMHYLIGLGCALFFIPIIKSFTHKEKKQEECKKTIKEEDTNTIMPNYYELLAVSKTANLDEIINAYENKKEMLINKYGTVLNEKGELFFKAYATLSDETSRAKYDEEYKHFLHQNIGTYEKLVPMFNKNKYLYTKISTDILIKNKESNKELYKIAKAFAITLVFMAIIFFLTKDFID